MANIKSSIKRAKLADKRNLKNRMNKSTMRTALKTFDAAIASGDKTRAEELFQNTVSIVDKSVSKGVIHKNAANRKKSQLATKLAKA